MIKVPLIRRLPKMLSHFIYDTVDLTEAHGRGSIKNRPGLVLKKKTQVSEKGKAFTTGKWMKASAEQHKLRLRKHEETVVGKKRTMEKDQKALETLGKHATAGEKLKKNQELLNSKLDERPDIRSSMVKSLEMVKSTHPRYDYWFKIWEEGQHREKYNETR